MKTDTRGRRAPLAVIAKQAAVAMVVLAMAAGLATSLYAKEEKTKKDDLYEEIELFANTVSIIRNDYVDEVKSKDLIYGALKGMLMSLDSHSQFLDPESYSEMKVETEGKFGGLGIEITIRDGILTVITAIEGTPAAEAGLKSNDKIVRIDGKSTRDVVLTEAVKQLRGEPGSTVTLTILREEEKKVFDVTVTRGIIQIKSIKEAALLEDKVGYVRLVEFQENSAKELAKGIATLKAKGMDSLILDLRNNPGGLLEVSVKVSEMFLSAGTVVVSTKSRIKNQDVVYKANSQRPFVGFPMIVLVNQGSASASEIVAGAIKDNKRGIIVGTRTFGKGSVQTLIPLSDGSAIRLTTAKYFTPSGQAIHNVGINPDVVVEALVIGRKGPKGEPDESDAIFEKIEPEKTGKEKTKEIDVKKFDNQLQAALDLIKGIKAYESLKAAPQ